MKKAINFKEEPLGRLMFKLSIPAFFAIVMNLLYGFVDGIFIGKGISSIALGGVTIVFPLTIMVVSFSTLVGEGVASMVARGVAARRESEVKDALKAGHAMTLWISMVIIFLTLFNVEAIVTVLGATEDIRGYATDYYRAILIGFPFLSLSLVYFHQLNAQGEMRIAMRAMLLSTLINILLDYLAIFIFDLGISGAGWATAVSQVIWYGYMHIHSLRDKKILTVVQPAAIRINTRSAKRIAALGFSSFVRQIGVSLALIIINTLAGRYGSSLHITAFGATQRIIRLLIAPIAALSMAMKPIIGQNYGFGEYKRVKDSLRYAFRAAFLLGTLLLVFLFLMRVPLGRLFGIAEEQIDVFVKILLLTSSMFPLYGVQHLAVSYFISLGKPKQAVLLNLLKQVIFLIPMIFILPLWGGIYGLFLAIPLSDLFTIGISALLIQRDTRILGAQETAEDTECKRR